MVLDSVNETPAQGGNAGATTTKLFDDALRKLRDALSDADKTHIKDFRNHKDMIASIRKASSYFAGNQRGLMRIAQRITAFSDAFAPFFDVVNVYVQIKPEWAAVFWVSAMLEEMAMILPQYEAWFNICKRTRVFTNTDRLSQSLAMLFSLLKQRIEKHRVWFETEAQIQQHDLLHQTYADFRQFLDSSSDEKVTGAQVSTQLAENARRVREIKSWINSSDYQSLYNHVNTQMHPECGKYVVQLPDYVRLKSLPFSNSNITDPNHSSDWLQRLIFLKGKPGLGKTFSSVRIIDDLRTTVLPLEPGEEEPSVVYFHYSQTDQYKDSSSIAWFRAISEQLIHAHRGDQLTLDSLAMIQSEEGSGQHVASTSDVRAVIDILLRQHPTFIVIDRVDECNNPEALLEGVRNDNLSRLIAQGILGNGVRKLEHLLQLTDMNLISILVDAAEGRFLWAKVLLNLLQSPALSPAARLTILQKPAELVSLDALYRRMLDMLGASSVDEQELAQKVFQWLLFSTMALNTASFHTVLAIHPGRPTTQLDYLTEYPQCIPRITCSLVELHADRDTFIFLHLPFKDFLLHKAHYNRRQNTTFSRSMRSVDFPERKGRKFEPDHRDAELQQWQQQCHDIGDLVDPRGFRERRRSPTSLYPEYCSGSASSTSKYTQSIASQRLHPEGRNILHQNIADVRGSQLALAETCLSYLIFDIPAQPLQAVRKEKPFCGFSLEAVSDSLEASAIDADMITNGSRRQDINVQYPFLRYSALCWQHHLVIGRGNRVDQAVSGTPELWITLLSQFLNINRFTVTMWTEASYHYHLVPQMGRQNPLIAQLMTSPSLPARPVIDIRAREYAWVGIGLHQLSGALKHLAERFGNRLLQNPSLIWQKDIEKAEDEEFWPNWEEEELTGMEVDMEGPFQQDSWQFDYDVLLASSRV
ncbi:hypothetical protein CHU98_g135 [Xylaria longipes]|nr:hypothetical protein CHU98_g135 [Xylaria longipes]